LDVNRVDPGPHAALRQRPPQIERQYPHRHRREHTEHDEFERIQSLSVVSFDSDTANR
jgi:hypothetical protein